jgi:hypothetical protein
VERAARRGGPADVGDDVEVGEPVDRRLPRGEGQLAEPLQELDELAVAEGLVGEHDDTVRRHQVRELGHLLGPDVLEPDVGDGDTQGVRGTGPHRRRLAPG